MDYNVVTVKKPKGYMVAQKTLARFRERITPLYEQDTDVRRIRRNNLTTQLLQSLKWFITLWIIIDSYSNNNSFIPLG
jgi:hypothetical protein